MIWCSSQETISTRGSLSIFGWEKTTSGWKGLHLETGECPVILLSCLDSLRCEISRSCRILMPKNLHRSGATMIVDGYDPVNLFEMVPKLELEFEPELA